MTLDEFNQLSPSEAAAQLRQCCTAERWIAAVAADRPFASEADLYAAADHHWANMDEADFLQAFEGHPKIGDVNSLREKYANTKAMAGDEQSGVQSANESVLQGLAEGNHAYEEKFGFIFIVFATGKSAAEMLDLLRARLPNTRQQELPIAAAEQHKITRLRIGKML